MSAASLPYAKDQRQLLGEWFKCFPDSTQENLDSFLAEHPDFKYSSIALLTTKRRQLLTLGVIDPVTQEDRNALAKGLDVKRKRKISRWHPAERHYINKRAANRAMRGQIKY